MNHFPFVVAKETAVAEDRTHHRWHDQPLYSFRFKEVLPFHDPGLAPVLSEEGAFHITLEGKPAYAKRFARTFGFYEGRAAVVTEEENWHHIVADGTSLGSSQFAWCGNFQGGFATVRTHDGRYHHIDIEGNRASFQSWYYAGDFRDGLAVVQREDGLHTHIDQSDNIAHGLWFLDLDVFHKGFARAKDEHGWMHISRLGISASRRRFAMVEPFYNGQARVERFDGGGPSPRHPVNFSQGSRHRESQRQCLLGGRQHDPFWRPGKHRHQLLKGIRMKDEWANGVPIHPSSFILHPSACGSPVPPWPTPGRARSLQ